MCGGEGEGKDRKECDIDEKNRYVADEKKKGGVNDVRSRNGRSTTSDFAFYSFRSILRDVYNRSILREETRSQSRDTDYPGRDTRYEHLGKI